MEVTHQEYKDYSGDKRVKHLVEQVLERENYTGAQVLQMLDRTFGHDSVNQALAETADSVAKGKPGAVPDPMLRVMEVLKTQASTQLPDAAGYCI